MIATIKRSLWAGGVVVVALAAIVSVMALALNVQAAKKDNNNDHKKVWVCKYVGTPGINERLSTGNQPSSVSVSTLKNGFNGTFPWPFPDAQGRSVAIAYDDGGRSPGRAACALKDAKIDVSTVAPTCEMGEQLIHSGVNATYKSGTPSGVTGPGSYSFTYDAMADHLFVDGKNAQTKSGTLAGKLAKQITNPNGDCYVKKPGHDSSKVVYRSHWRDIDATCTRENVLQNRSIKTQYIAYHWNGDEWSKTTSYKWTSEERTRDFTEAEIARCHPVADPLIATADVVFTEATCKTGQTLSYVMQNATVAEGSSPIGATGHYLVTFKANDGAEFVTDADNKTTLVFEGDLAGPSTAPECEDGDVLGGTDDGTNTGTPVVSAQSNTVKPAALPYTAGETTTVVMLAGGFVALIAGAAGVRRLLSHGL